MKKGIAALGNLIVDVIKEIDTYPKAGNLTNITDVVLTTGGLCPNCLTDLYKMDPSIHLEVVGLIGNDDYGDMIIDSFEKMNIDTSHITRHKILGTSFTDVMNDSKGKERTFFQYSGANSAFGYEHIDFDTINADILHFGYILLLDEMDRHDEEYGTVMARSLAKAQEKGFKTSIDIVSEEGDRFKKIVPHALKYTDYCIVNEIEASKTTGIKCRDENKKLILGNMKPMCKALKKLGVSTWVVIHSPEGGFGLDENDEFFVMPSVDIPANEIKGKTGAGDAFCSGILYAAYKDFGLEQALIIANGAAASCLREVNATDGILPASELLKLYDIYGKVDMENF